MLTPGERGGAEQFCAPKLGGGPTYMDLDYYKVFSDAGYSVVDDNTTLTAPSNSDRLLGIFSISNMAKCKTEDDICFRAAALTDLQGLIETSTLATSKGTKMLPIAAAETQTTSPDSRR